MSRLPERFMLGIAHPCPETSPITGMGFEWVRPAFTPFPIDQSGQLTEGYLAYREQLRLYKAAGLQTLSISPYPRDFMRYGIDPRTPEGLKKVREVCRFLAHDLREFVPAWQVANEIVFVYFRAPLDDDQACDFLIESMRGIREGNPEAFAGHNSLDNLLRWLPWCERFEKETGGSDYVGYDLYAGTWSVGNEETYIEDIEKIQKALGLPVIMTEFGYASRGEVAADIEAEMLSWLSQRGIHGYADMEARLSEVIPMLPQRMQDTMRVAGSKHDQLEYLYQSKSHILHKWPRTSARLHTEEDQAAFYDRLLELLIAQPGVRGAFAFSWKDNERCYACGSADCPCETAWGMVRKDGSEKPVAEVIRKYAKILHKEL